ncbi:MAG: hypothetical protein IKM90_02315 [Bacteroidaceae bacterium]|nr:hypothetical protein [Bacteroidaceae bacterium]
MTKKTILILLLFFSCAIHAIAQSDFYYYQGKKVPLTPNGNLICISIPKNSSDVNERVRANVQVLANIKDDSFYIMVISRSDYEKLTSLNSWEEDLKSIIITYCYLTENNDPVAASPYINVKLKQKENTDLLASYLEEYKMVISYSSTLSGWYILAMTPDSPLEVVECANKLYESGNFSSSAADFVSFNDALAVKLITTTPAVKSIELYDLSGRPVKEPSGLTIVVTRYSDGSIRTEKRLYP